MAEEDVRDAIEDEEEEYSFPIDVLYDLFDYIEDPDIDNFTCVNSFTYEFSCIKQKKTSCLQINTHKVGLSIDHKDKKLSFLRFVSAA